MPDSRRNYVTDKNRLSKNQPGLVADYWDYTKNVVAPEDVAVGSSKKVWWGCGKHSWESSVAKVVGGTRCPVCSGRVVIPGDNDFASNYPDLLVMWDFTENSLRPDEVAKSSGKDAQWTCGAHKWTARIDSIVRGNRCPSCSRKRLTVGENDLLSRHPDLVEGWWDHSANNIRPDEISVGNAVKKVWWSCPQERHPSWESTVSNMVKGSRCPYCSGRSAVSGSTDIKTTHPEIVNSYWDFDKNIDISPEALSYGSNKKAWWKCEEGHSRYSVVADVVLFGTGCTNCGYGVSKGEDELVEALSQLGIPEEDIVRNDRTLLGRKEVDILIPGRSVAIEFNGVYWHSTRFKTKDYDKSKMTALKSQGIDLIVVWEDDWSLRKNTVVAHIRHRLGLSEARVYARNTYVDVLSKEEARDFTEKYHLQGYGRGGTIRVGLRASDTDDLVATMVLARRASGDLELARYATSLVVPGGHSKLVTHVETNYDYRNLVTFADIQVSQGDLYRKTGWSFDKEIGQDYRYCVGNQRVHKFNYRKKRFKSDPKLQYDPDMTESELATLNNLHRVYDYGKLRFIKPHPNRKDSQ